MPKIYHDFGPFCTILCNYWLEQIERLGTHIHVINLIVAFCDTKQLLYKLCVCVCVHVCCRSNRQCYFYQISFKLTVDCIRLTKYEKCRTAKKRAYKYYCGCPWGWGVVGVQYEVHRACSSSLLDFSSLRTFCMFVCFNKKKFNACFSVLIVLLNELVVWLELHFIVKMSLWIFICIPSGITGVRRGWAFSESKQRLHSHKMFFQSCIELSLLF